jgi:hypothetical protein
MTNEEAIKWIKYHIGISDYEETDELLKAFELAIKALELEPHYDCVSRQEIEDAIANTIVNGESLGYGLAWDILYDLPPVTPQPKIGRWAILKDEYGDIVDAVCSCCDEHGNHEWTFCPHCGARMEVEDK